MSFSDDIENEFAAIIHKRNNVVADAALDLYANMIKASPVDTGELRRSWQLPKEIRRNTWLVSNYAPHALIIDGGRRKVATKNGMKWVGSEQLQDGYAPVIKRTEKTLQKELNRL